MGRKEGKNTGIIPKSTGNPDGKYYSVDNGETLVLAFRPYIDSETGIEPAY